MTGGADRSAAIARLLRWLAPSLAFAVWGALTAGFVEAMAALGDPVTSVAAAGFLALLWVPLMLLASVAVRGLWLAWRPVLLAIDAPDPNAAAARLAAWCLYAIAGLAVVWRVGLVSAANLMVATEASAAATATVSTAITIGLALLLIACSRPIVAGIAAIFAMLDRATRRRALTPARILAVSVAIAIALLWLAWTLWIRPRFASLNLAPLYPLWLGLGAGALADAAWRLVLAGRRRAAAIFSATSAACVVLALVAAGHAWARRPARALAIWGETVLCGHAVDSLVDVWELGRETAPTVVSRPDRQTRPDVILVTIDTLRADRTPVYGGAAKMPALSKLAEAGAVLEWAFAPGNVTRRSLPAIATGISPPRLRGRVSGWAYRLDPRHVTFPELFQAGGYDTAGFFCCGSIFGRDQKLGLVRGIDHLFVKEYACEDLALEAVRYIRARKRQGDPDPMFAWLHFFEPHQWHQIHVPGRGKVTVERRYAAALERVDGCLDTLLSALWVDIREGETVVAVTSDHGEGLGSHGIRHHSGTLYNSEIHVPLVIAGPEIQPRRIETPVGIVDLAPTLLDLAGFVPPGMPAMDGDSLVPLLRGDVPDNVAQGEAYAATIPDHSTTSEARALVVGRYKLIVENGKAEVYDFVADPGEAKNLAPLRPRLLSRLKNALHQRRVKDRISPITAPP